MTFRTHQRHVKILKQAKGFRGRAKNCYTIAVRQVHRKWQKAYSQRSSVLILPLLAMLEEN